MRAILWLIAAGAIAFGGFWALASRAVLKGAEAALQQMQSAGTGDFASVGLGGFPSRFDIKIEAPALASADGYLRWAAPFLQIYALSYRPNHVIAVWPEAQSLARGPESITVTSDDMRASAVFGLGLDIPLERAHAVATGLAVQSDFGWALTLNELRLAIRRDAQAEYAQNIGGEMFGLDLSQVLAAQNTSADAVPQIIERGRLDAVLRLNVPLDRFAREKGVRIIGIGLRALELDWADVRIRGTGDLEINAAGQPVGRIALRATNWRMALQVAISLGWIRAEIADTVERVFAQLAAASGDAAVLELPLIFSGGRMSLGPIPLGPAPTF